MDIRVASFAELDARTLYDLLRLRVDVFVVEQKCPYPELDGRDLLPDTRHVWLAEGGTPVAYLRILSEPDGTARIGRVVVAAHARGSGLAGRLMAAALAVVGDRACVLNAQTLATGLYERYGFVASGPEFLEDGIPHIPMIRACGGRCGPTEGGAPPWG
ncbi:GNAT family N-acetyltransferase [Actinomycetes bacterium KLBMP 9797]